ncbi:MAG TPA: SIMPL domain-containing protein [Polyangiaceae bacterium]|jgi:uncharacterized protein YggE
MSRTRALLTTLTLLVTPACGTTYVTAQSVPTEHTITVDGSASADVVPDEACIELTLAARDASMPAAHAALVAQSSALGAELRQRSELVVENGSIAYTPEYDTDAGRARLARYVASEQVNVRVRDFGRIADVIGRGAAHGLDRVSVTYYSTKIASRKSEVRAHALEAAREKARMMTSTLGVSLGDVITIVEGDAHGNGQTGAASYLDRASVDRVPDVPAPPGAIPLAVNVSVVYRVR